MSKRYVEVPWWIALPLVAVALGLFGVGGGIVLGWIIYRILS